MSKAGRAATVMHLALDACDSALLQDLAARGDCPNVASLLQDGAVVDTVAPFGTFVGSSWMTIATGLEVGRHRFHNWAAIDPDTYAVRSTSPREASGTPYWEALSAADRRVAVLDVPHARLPDDLHGVLVKEWGCHDRHDGPASHPAELLAELDSVSGGHPFGSMAFHTDQFAPCDYTLRDGGYRTSEEERALVDALLRGVEARAAASVAVLDRCGWDLFTSVLGETHCVGHQLWHVHDPSHPRHDVVARELLGDPVEAVYRRADAWLGAHLSRADESTTVYVQLNHGMGPHYDGDHLLDEIVRRIDESDDGWVPGVRSRAVRAATGAVPDRLARRVDPLVAAAIRRRAASAPPRPADRPGPGPHRRAFQLPGNTSVGAIRCNVVGRESQGRLHPGPELDAFLDALSAGLLEVIDVATGRRAVRSVVRAEEVLERFPGDTFGDLYVEWDRTTLMEHVWSPRIGSVAAPYTHWRTGDHHDRGLLLVRGPGIRAGRRQRPMALTDIAPTICASLGVTLDQADGEPWPDLVAGGSWPSPRKAHQPLRTLQPTVRPTAVVPAPGVDGPIAKRALHLADDAMQRLQAAEEAIAAVRTLLGGVHNEAANRLAALERERLVRTTMAWLAQEPVVEDQLISIVTPTYERPEKLRRAIASVVAQRYGRWELVVVDDGGDTAKAVVAGFGDDRVRAVRMERNSGPAAARNRALEEATGDVVTYLDDDNVFDPGWLHAVAWAFRNHPGSDVLYGARLIDDERRVHGDGAGGWPWMQFNAYDRAALELGNFADMGVLAHRAGLPSARFDEALWECADWDIFLALTEDKPPLELPAIALYYHTDGRDRLTGQYVDHEQVVRDKWAARRAAGEGVPPAAEG